MSIKVMMVDDHRMLCEGIRQLLSFDDELEIVCEASTGKEAIKMYGFCKPDVILLDINLPDISGIQVLRTLKRKTKKVKILMLTVHNEVEYLIDAIESGADGYILKDSGSNELIDAIKCVYAGRRYVEPGMIPSLNARLIQKDNETIQLRDITRREHEMLSCIAKGMSNLEISEKYGISERTVKNHISNLYKKIKVKDRTQAVVFAIRNNLVQM